MSSEEESAMGRLYLESFSLSCGQEWRDCSVRVFRCQGEERSEGVRGEVVRGEVVRDERGRLRSR